MSVPLPPVSFPPALGSCLSAPPGTGAGIFPESGGSCQQHPEQVTWQYPLHFPQLHLVAAICPLTGHGSGSFPQAAAVRVIRPTGANPALPKEPGGSPLGHPLPVQLVPHYGPSQITPPAYCSMFFSAVLSGLQTPCTWSFSFSETTGRAFVLNISRKNDAPDLGSAWTGA